MNAEYDNHFKLEFQPEMSCIFVLEVSNLPLSTIFRLDIGPVPTVCFFPLFNTNLISKFEINAGKGTRHFNPLEDYRFFHHWFSGVKTP
jgi:hypothetical protein